MKRVGLYYSDFSNFGDALNLPLLEALTGNSSVVRASYLSGNLMAVGSIFYGGGHFWGARGSFFSKDRMRYYYRRYKNFFLSPMIVWGSGMLFDLPIPKDVVIYRDMRVAAVRGAETLRILRNVGVVGPEACPILGDPGLFYPDLIPDVRNVSKKYELAIVPHYSDYKIGLALGEKLVRVGLKVKVVDVMQADHLNVVREIASAQKVLSASLHGLIVADSLGIPNRHLILSDYEVDRYYGKGMSMLKFKDYYSAFGITSHNPLNMEQLMGDSCSIINSISSPAVPQDDVMEVKRHLIEVFPEEFRGGSFGAFKQVALREPIG